MTFIRKARIFQILFSMRSIRLSTVCTSPVLHKLKLWLKLIKVKVKAKVKIKSLS